MSHRGCSSKLTYNAMSAQTNGGHCFILHCVTVKYLAQNQACYIPITTLEIKHLNLSVHDAIVVHVG